MALSLPSFIPERPLIDLVPEVVTIPETVHEKGEDGSASTRGSLVAIEENKVYQSGEAKKVIIAFFSDSHLEYDIYFRTE